MLPSLHLRRDLPAIAPAWGCTVALALLTYRSGRRLTFDGYYYCEYAKEFAHRWPDRFGTDWPFGYPMLGALISRLGLPAYEALCVVSLLFLGLLMAFSARMLTGHPLRGPVLFALAAAPVVATQLFGVLTELPFAAVWLGLVISLAHWPERRALWSTACWAVLALTLRYVGGIALGLMILWLAAQWPVLRARKRTGEALGAVITAGLGFCLLLGLNVLKSGHASGADRGTAGGFRLLPHHLMDFGWSLPSAVFAGGLRDRLGAESPAGQVLGASIFLLFAAGCVWAWCRPVSVYSRPLALAALGYAGGMAALHCIGNFDALYNARTFLPALFPFAILLAERFASRRALVLAACALFFIAGLVAAGRGISRQIGGDVSAAIGPLRSKAGPTDWIAINDDAFSISAYFPQRTRRVWAEYWPGASPDRLLVVAGKPADRAGNASSVSPPWIERCAELVSHRRYRYLVQTPSLLVLERLDPAP